jgi:hydroxymethylpyrimidine/phosphomethylpyrimidine kinase
VAVGTQPAVAALSVAGSDSGGGAGIQADLRVFHRLGVFGTTAITAVTAQNLTGVRAVGELGPEVIQQQIEAVLEGFPVRAAKTGMLWSAAIVEAVADALAGAGIPFVVDPVMVATSGARLLDAGAVAAYRERLLPHATLVTPNLDEAAVLLDRLTIDPEDLPGTAEALHHRLGCPVLLKGGHLAGDPIDLLHDGTSLVRWTHARIAGVDTHGSGCMLSAAVTAHLALGHDLTCACERGLAFVHDALDRARPLGDAVRLADIEHAVADRDALTRLP